MSGDNYLRVLLNVKTHREEQISRRVKQTNEEVRRAEEESRRAKDHVRRSKETLSSRYDDAYSEIIGKVVKLDDIEQTKAKVVRIDKDHDKLVDAETRAVHTRADKEKLRDQALVEHKSARATVEKYKILTERLSEAEATLAEKREEDELEDTSGSRRRKFPTEDEGQ
jgi:hypothetical protein